MNLCWRNAIPITSFPHGLLLTSWVMAAVVCAPVGELRAQQAGAPADGEATVANQARAIETVDVDTAEQQVVRHPDADRSPIAERPDEASSPQINPRGRAGGATRSWYLTGLLSLAVVLGLIFLLARLARRFTPLKNKLGQGELEIVARTHLGPKQSVAVVRLGQRLVLVGVTPERLNCLSTIDDPAEAAALLGRLAVGKAGSTTAHFSAEFDAEVEEYAAQEAVEPLFGEQRTTAFTRTRRQLGQMIGKVRALGRSSPSPG